MLIVLDSDPQTAASGVWCTMFFIYMTYTLLALHLQECAVAGVLLGVTQLAAGAALNYQDPNMGKQVRPQGFCTWAARYQLIQRVEPKLFQELI